MAGVVASKVRKQRASMKKNKDGDEEDKTRDIKVRITEVKHLVSLIQLNCLFSQIPVGPPSLDKGRNSRVSLQKH